MRDLPLYLPDGVYLTALTITPDFTVLSDLMQRAIVLLVCSEDDGFKIDGKTLLQFLRQSTTGGASNIAPELSGVADTLKAQLNGGDGVVDIDEDLVSSVAFEIEVDGATATVNLVIQQIGNDPESTVIYKYE